LEEILKMDEPVRKSGGGRGCKKGCRWKSIEESQEVAEAENRLQMEEPRRDPGSSRGWKKE
jgi:hypothetical protein